MISIYERKAGSTAEDQEDQHTDHYKLGTLKTSEELMAELRVETEELVKGEPLFPFLEPGWLEKTTHSGTDPNLDQKEVK